jgi:TolB-like protein/Tfp pilus assembly protein PilF
LGLSGLNCARECLTQIHAMNDPLVQPANARGAPPVPDYEMLRPIGRGSYGDVWLARGVTGIYRAVKVVWRDRFENAEPFEREFRGLRDFAAISLKAKGQMALLHIGRNDAAGFFYYVMELADDANTGRTFDPATYVPLTLKEWRQRKGRVPASDVVAAGVELASALAALHASGLVHRDIKPSNGILVNGQAKLADIGLVASAGEARTFIGTVGYVPPEGPGSPAADVFALGCVLYELATGLDRDEFPKLPPELNRLPDQKLLFALNEIILRACEANPARRYPGAGAMLKDLLALQAGSAHRGRRKLLLMITTAGLVVVAIGFSFWWKLHSGPPAGAISPPAPAAVAEKSVAVLAFANLSDDKEQEYFSDGISEELLNALSRVPGLKVSARTSAFHFKGKDTPIPEIAKQLGVAYVVEGSVRKAGNRVRIAVQLVKAADGFQVWSENYDRELRDIFAVQDEITKNILAAVKVQVLGERDRVRAVPTNLEAYNFYLRAQALLSARTEPDLREAIQLYESAVASAPDYAPAWVGLAWARGLLPSYAALSGAGAKEMADKSKQAAQRALELEPDNASALALLGWVHSWLEWRWDEGLAELARAAELAPNSAEVLNLQGDILRMACEYDRALEVKQRAWQLDPLGVAYNFDVAYVRLMRREYDQAIVLGEATVRVWPQNLDAYCPIIFAAGRSGQFSLMRRTVEVMRQNVHNSDGRRLLVEAHAAIMDRRIDEAGPLLAQAAKLAEVGKASPAYMGYCYLLAGDTDQAKAWLQRAVELHDPFINWDVFIDLDVLAANPVSRPILDVPGIREMYELRQRNRHPAAAPR